MAKSVIMCGFRHTVESPRYHFPDAELWSQSTSIRPWQWTLYDWSRWFDIHTIEPQSFYPGIKAMRPDVLSWYYLQGSERPIYFTKQYPDILASRAYPIEAITEEFGANYFGSQLDYMGALALSEGFDRWILYGVGQPYCRERESAATKKWWHYHGTFMYWLRMANKRGVEILFDTPASNLITPEMLLDEERYPTPSPLKYRYGYDMGTGSSERVAAEMGEYA
jgi:hypothetical protein